MKTESGVRQAMILAAGKGTRLEPLTRSVPKVLLQIDGGTPLIDYTFAWLKKYGIEEVVINIHHLGNLIREYISNEHLGIKVTYSLEETLLGTAGGVKRMEHFFKNDFLVICGDILTDFNLSRMVKLHNDRKSQATLAVVRMPSNHEVGVVKMDGQNRITSLVEKPKDLEEPYILANGGVYLFNNRVLDLIPQAQFCDFAYDLFPKLIQRQIPFYGYQLDEHDYLLDIGAKEKYLKAKEDVHKGLVKIPLNLAY